MSDLEPVLVDMREMGRRGGRATADKSTPRQRRIRARKAVKARWAKYRKAQALKSTEKSTEAA